MVPNTALLGVAGAFVAEVWMTAILMFVILGIGDEAAGSVPAAAQPALVGATVTTLICTFGPVTGCGMNPARDLGPREAPATLPNTRPISMRQLMQGRLSP